ncbi:major facilitator superfamily domain-containing protein [Gamsiella multidivaricata]|uniref:major facilitator superfamily domain-containing protein n=1 Tax=Gamsiella multidivaricata TaxID=101098 RepID=UPI00221E7148|nr:major facilitator superfamily domain-containing protein [Gamsiella multidivaricata]KAI7829849.1 major facilitator superfamily domain-containing protein [Gamsiella multidivaricata]
MALRRVPTYENTLANDRPDDSTQLESFPPLYITRSNVLDTPPLTLESLPSDHLEKLKEDQTTKRWWILLFACLLLFGNCFAYDNPAALNTQLQKYLGMPYNDYQYLLSTLYSVYSLPNTVLPFLFGSLVDRFGPQRVLVALSACVCIGQAIFSIGVQTRQIWMMLVGRAIFGIGGESCGVAQASITTTQFRGQELAFALGLNLCMARFGSVVNAIVTPWVEQEWGVPTAVWIGTLSCVASFLSAITLVSIISESGTPASYSKEDLEDTRLLSSASRTIGANDASNGPYFNASSSHDNDLAFSSSHLRSPTQSSILQHLSGVLRQDSNFSESIHSIRFTPGLRKSGKRPSLYIITDQTKKKESWWEQWLSDLKFFPSTFWLICVLTVLLYGTVVPFNNIASDFLQSKWYHGKPRKAAAVMGIPDTIGAILVPGFGLIVDRYGRRASILIASAFVMVIVHTTLGFTMLNPIIGFSCLGVAYTMYGVALWPSIACVVTSELHLGKGYGISTSFLNISLTVIPPIVAMIRVVGNSFVPVEMLFISMGLCGIVVAFVLKSIDHRDGGALEQPEIEVDVPVIVPQSTVSTPAATLESPATSHRRSPYMKKKRRPALNVLQMPASASESDWSPRRRRGEETHGVNVAAGEGSPLLQKKTGEEDEHINNGRQGNSSTLDASPAQHNLPTSTVMSPTTARNNRPQKRFSRPLLHKALTRLGGPLSHQYPSSPLYGSVSSSPLAFGAADRRWDIEGGGSRTVSGMEGYGMSQHPILYIPLRGSSSSFRIRRNPRPVAFGEGEEGRIYWNGQVVESDHGDDDEPDTGLERETEPSTAGGDKGAAPLSLNNAGRNNH